jgi:hypothetical protein
MRPTVAAAARRLVSIREGCAIYTRISLDKPAFGVTIRGHLLRGLREMLGRLDISNSGTRGVFATVADAVGSYRTRLTGADSDAKDIVRNLTKK